MLHSLRRSSEIYLRINVTNPCPPITPEVTTSAGGSELEVANQEAFAPLRLSMVEMGLLCRFYELSENIRHVPWPRHGPTTGPRLWTGRDDPTDA